MMDRAEGDLLYVYFENVSNGVKFIYNANLLTVVRPSKINRNSWKQVKRKLVE